MELRSVEIIVDALNAAEVRYLVVGGLAVVAHGFERLTKDVDLVIGLERVNIIHGLKALASVGYLPIIPVSNEAFADAQTREMWRHEKNMLVLKMWSDAHRRTPIDVFVYEPFDFDAEYARAEKIEVSPGISVPVVSIEALLAMKRDAGRPQDLADIEALEAIQKFREDRKP